MHRPRPNNTLSSVGHVGRQMETRTLCSGVADHSWFGPIGALDPAEPQ